MVFFPCVVVENLFYRFLLALGEYVADVIKTSREAGVDLYLGAGVGGSWSGGKRVVASPPSRASSGAPVSDISSMRLCPGVGVAASVSSGAAFHSLMRSVSPVAGRSRRAETSWGPQGGARLEALHDGLLLLGHIRVLSGEDLLEGEEVAV